MGHDSGKPKRHFLTRTARRIISFVVVGVIGGLVMLITVAVLFLNHRPDLDPWHTVYLDEEFTADAGLTSFDEYLALEERLFKQLDQEVYAITPADTRSPINRYDRGSRADPSRWPTSWNRTFELSADAPRAGVLMLHGMSDSPYSMRSLGQTLHAHGATVLVMRVPGHGTAPSGLVHVEWQDMAAAVDLAAKHLREQVGDRPIYVVGYSNGGALAVHYALTTLEDESLPPVQGVMLMSPEIGITKLAALAAWQERLGHLLGLGKLSWNSIGPEYDPFQYKSFALNAGKQAHLITGEIQTLITEVTARGDVDRFPALLAFQSVVDATVSAPALVQGLFERLPRGNHELVLFDLNRMLVIDEFLKKDPRQAVDALLSRSDLTFTITLVTNENEPSGAVVARRHAPGDKEVTETDLGLTWPKDLYSLAHIALPFPPDDPVYGGPDAGPSPGVQFGNLVLHGEKGVLEVPPGDLLRIHWNPFHSYLEERMLEFTGLADSTGAAGSASDSGQGP